LLLCLLLADHAHRRSDRDPEKASRLHRPIRARRLRRGRCRVKTMMRFALPLGLIAGLLATAPAFAIDTTRLPPTTVHFSFEGPSGPCGGGALQRVFKVYKEVCATCHSLDHVAFHDLDEEGGPGFSEAQAKAIAAGYKIPADPNDKGDIFDDKGVRLTRPGTL